MIESIMAGLATRVGYDWLKRKMERKDKQTVTLTDEARQILTTAANGQGNVSVYRFLGNPGVDVMASNESMLPKGANDRTVAMWLGAVGDLEKAGYIVCTGRDKHVESYRVTREGYERVGK